ncbi:MAG: YceI family protein [Bacteroidales bacterium]|nr:YceI family protein [Bacteroidales bacterium]MBS3776207.1 YceI family protein [Bacteroidales bacterium]
MKNKHIKFSTRMISRFITLILIHMIIAIPAMSQESIQLSIASNTELSFDGTSNVHDWDSEITELTGQGAFAQSLLNGSNSQENPVKDVKVSIPVKSIESGKNKMNDIMYDALKAEEHPEIEYELISSEVIQKSGNEFTLQTNGYLTVAGVTKQIALQVKGKQLDDQTIQFTGSKNLKMTDFNVDPPKALFGAIKSGDEVDVKFTAVFSK